MRRSTRSIAEQVRGSDLEGRARIAPGPPLSADMLDLVAERRERRRDPLAVIALDLQFAVLDRAAGAALLLERPQERFERHGVMAQAAHYRDRLAAAALAVAPDSRR